MFGIVVYKAYVTFKIYIKGCPSFWEGVYTIRFSYKFFKVVIPYPANAIFAPLFTPAIHYLKGATFQPVIVTNNTKCVAAKA